MTAEEYLMETGNIEEVRKHVKVYLVVFAALGVLTLVTVGIAYIDLSIFPAVILALIVASVKGTLVASYFMHLISEKKAIYGVLAFTALFLIVMLLVPLFTTGDMLTLDHESLPAPPPEEHVEH